MTDQNTFSLVGDSILRDGVHYRHLFDASLQPRDCAINGRAVDAVTYTGVIPHDIMITIGGQPITRDAMRRHIVLTADRLTAAGKIVSIDWSALRPSRGWARHVRRAKARAAQ